MQTLAGWQLTDILETIERAAFYDIVIMSKWYELCHSTQFVGNMSEEQCLELFDSLDKLQTDINFLKRESCLDRQLSKVYCWLVLALNDAKLDSKDFCKIYMQPDFKFKLDKYIRCAKCGKLFNVETDGIKIDNKWICIDCNNALNPKRTVNRHIHID